ncbi:hypothetical protein [Methanobrevibacter thaueri]|uniref:Uncharacterized protein n=1 Tax=Methanobrevibacter thaueri TaxID=190975 RepID=A0A315XP15_9EURY|nr:hypothetical protein [Methanobrevibacter thaueri]PWB87880.1 hypothetical protein MBBTH_04670 [Methanobrevibacter thaueri]
MELSNSLNQRIDNMRSGQKKELWEQLRESERVYTYIPPVYKINEQSRDFKSYMSFKSIEGLEGMLRYYRHVQGIYNYYDFILTPIFFEDNIHVNEIDILHVSDKSRKQIDTMCNRLSKKIEKSR